jgi:hypothetical protein
MHFSFRSLRIAGALLLLASLGLGLAACDSTDSATATAVPTAGALPTDTPSQRSQVIGQALQTGGTALTFKTALAKARPEAIKWEADAVLEVAALVATDKSASGAWNFTYASPDGQQRVLIGVSGVDTQTQKLSGAVNNLVVKQLTDHAALLDQALDSPDILDKVKALNYTTDDKDQVKIVYYVSGEDVGISAYPNPVVQVRMLKGDVATQLTLDALTGAVISKSDQ